ncbi:MAG: hypothetical protein CSB44_10830 [Gammaproteobacteria bacterium]|nr:MAG: hypothetical protein CSB44_10830 [Gammaproteobacteria bacterium]PIE36873.1 MAG: hypothetical protein CSA54_02925 [Gammaproteobacteria bacterium]
MTVFSRVSVLFLLPLLVSLTACASAPSSEREIGGNGRTTMYERASANSRARLDAIGAGRIGSSVRLAAGNPLAARSATLLSEYQAASGRRCRQVRPFNSDVRRIVCQQRSGQWRLVRSLLPEERAEVSPTASILADVTDGGDGSAVAVADDMSMSAVAHRRSSANRTVSAPVKAVRSVSPVQARIEPGETFWAFSRRTTGRGSNWAEIARYNDIDDVQAIRPGTRLSIPAALVREP